MDAYLALEKAKEAGHDLSRSIRWLRSSCPAWTPRSTRGWRRSARPTRSRCAARPASPTRLAYAAYEEVFGGEALRRTQGRGCPRAACPLWASTGVKNPSTPTPVRHRAGGAEHGQHHAGEDARRGNDHGVITGDTISGTAAASQDTFDKLAAIGVDLTDVIQIT